MVMLMQSSMSELVNVSWIVVLVKSRAAMDRSGKRGSGESYTQNMSILQYICMKQDTKYIRMKQDTGTLPDRLLLIIMGESCTY